MWEPYAYIGMVELSYEWQLEEQLDYQEALIETIQNYMY